MSEPSRPAGYSGTPLPQKLGIKPGHAVLLVAPPADLVRTLGRLPAGVVLSSRSRGTQGYDVIVVFARTQGELTRRFAAARARLVEAGGLWLAWPKKGSGLSSELGDASVRAYGLSQGLVDNKVCAIDATWSGLRFVVRVRDRTTVRAARARPRPGAQE
jgi:hypothetical protein